MPQESSSWRCIEWNEALDEARDADPGSGPDLDALERELTGESRRAETLAALREAPHRPTERRARPSST